ncbi:MAG: nucleoside hydrolase [Clostridia bacterium]|nr:nucleoside hydrolase [Clostridia bacterium]
MTHEQYLKNLQPPKGVVDVILDTDTFNEADDQFAVALALRSPEKINMLGFTVAPFFNSNSTSPEDGMLKSYDEMMRLLTLDGREDMKKNVYRGSRTYLPDEKTPVESDAANFIAETAKRYSPEKPLYVVAIGAGTNVASAILKAPEAMRENTVIVWLSGHAREWPDTAEFNMRQDIAAARVIFGCGAPVVQLPCMGVVSAFVTTKHEMEHWLKGKNPIADYLYRFVTDEMDKHVPDLAWSRCIWDVTAVGWLLNEDNRFMKSYLATSPIVQYDNHYSFDPARHPICYVYHIKRDQLFTEFFRKLGN